VEVRPHFVVRRFADLLVALLVLTHDFPHPDVLAALAALRTEVFALLDRLATAAAAGLAAADARELRRRVFVLTNVDVVASLVREKELAGPDAAWIEEHLENEMSGFVGGRLTACCGPLMQAGREKTGKV